MDFGRHEADVGKTCLVHAIGNIANAKDIEELEDLLVLLLRVDFGWDKVVTGTQLLVGWFLRGGGVLDVIVLYTGKGVGGKYRKK